LAGSNTDILLLDEPTSSVDNQTESKIYENLFSAFEGRNIIVSMHRLENIHRFQYIIYASKWGGFG